MKISRSVGHSGCSFSILLTIFIFTNVINTWGIDSKTHLSNFQWKVGIGGGVGLYDPFFSIKSGYNAFKSEELEEFEHLTGFPFNITGTFGFTKNFSFEIDYSRTLIPYKFITHYDFGFTDFEKTHSHDLIFQILSVNLRYNILESSNVIPYFDFGVTDINGYCNVFQYASFKFENDKLKEYQEHKKRTKKWETLGLNFGIGFQIFVYSRFSIYMELRGYLVGDVPIEAFDENYGVEISGYRSIIGLKYFIR